MHIESLQVFCDLVETSSFSGAAERNELSQSAVSQQLRNLEERYGATLIERGSRNFSVTPEGDALLQAARAILGKWEGVERQIRDLQSRVEGELHLATVYSLGLKELPPQIDAFKTKFPNVEIKLLFRSANKVYAEVLEGSVDLGFVPYPQQRKGVLIESHWKDELVLVCPASHVFARNKNVKLSALADERFIAFGPDLPTRKAIDAFFKNQGVSVKHRTEFDNIDTVKRAVELENSTAIIPRKDVEEEVKARKLVALSFHPSRLWRPLGIVQKRTKARSPAMREFINFLIESEV